MIQFQQVLKQESLKKHNPSVYCFKVRNRSYCLHWRNLSREKTVNDMFKTSFVNFNIEKSLYTGAVFGNGESSPPTKSTRILKRPDKHEYDHASSNEH